MNGSQAKALKAVFAEPTRANVKWAEIETLLVGVGCEIIEGAGSRVRFAFKTEVETFHRPHPAKEAKRYQVRAARDFLTRIGITP